MSASTRSILLKEKFRAFSAQLPTIRPEEQDLYEAHFGLLTEWNAKINLVSRKSIDTSFEFHYADSLQIADFVAKHRGGREVKDLGTGAGFPGVIFAIRYPDVKVRLFEKLAKRRAFLEDVIQKLGLKNVALEGPLPEKKFSDFFTARAVFPVDELFPFMKRHFSPGGRLAVTLGGAAEIPKGPKGFRLVADYSYELPESAGGRKIAIYDYVPRETK